MRIGLLGGSFDPVHYGHLLVAECCREDCQLDQVWFVPAAISPHKRQREPTPAKARLEMLHLATAGHSQLEVCSLEIDRGGVSYTVDTLAAIARQRPDAQLFLLMGTDTLQDLPTWREPSRILQLALPIVVNRSLLPEADWGALADLAPPDRLQEAQRYAVQMPRVELSSSEIRRRVASGRSIRYWTPRAVERYIQTHRLYLA
jgi:nicotinate-nucleotide adenylyltransferase